MNENKTNINWYPGHMAKTKREIISKINQVDIVIEILDARIPYSSKNPDIDGIINNKPHILIMSKSDLCDINETNKWIKKYESMGKIVINLNLLDNTSSKKIYEVIDKIMAKQNARRLEKGMFKKIPKCIVLGIPNVGKSTLINNLLNRKAAKVGNMPGVTKNITWLKASGELLVLDTPGILYPKIQDEIVGLNLATFTAIKESILPIEDVSWYALKSLYKYYPNIAKERYGDISFELDYDDIYMIIAKKRGFISCGNTPNYDRINMAILNDIKSGLIKNITFDRIENYES